ncbi:DUF6643 family protein [Streptomyces hoynatensis]|uniref:DUF6643 family protein n=1 Tax=Streptomyces hoynatensis TaxID=1141874 RepID=UPI001F4DE240|nr:DUF6643 family protein [Streptomyces hoynatensis]
MTSPRPYGGYSSPSFPDTPIYDRLVAERGTPQIAPIRVPSAYEPLGYQHSPSPALPALPALPAGPSHAPASPMPGHPQPHPQPTGGYPGYQATPVRQQLPAAPTPQPPAPYFPQQATAPRPYPAPQAPQAPLPQQMRPAAPRPAPPRPMPGTFQQPGQGAYQTQQHPYPAPGYWSEQGGGQ